MLNSFEARLIRTLIFVKISLGKESYLAGLEGKHWQLINFCWQLKKFCGRHKWENTFIFNICCKFYEVRLIRTMFLVETSLGIEPDLAGFKSKLWQLINSCWQLMIFFDNMDEKLSSWLVCNQTFMKLGCSELWF